MCFIQETKKGDISSQMVTRIWSGDDFEWLAQPSCGLSSGILFPSLSLVLLVLQLNLTGEEYVL